MKETILPPQGESSSTYESDNTFSGPMPLARCSVWINLNGVTSVKSLMHLWHRLPTWYSRRRVCVADSLPINQVHGAATASGGRLLPVYFSRLICFVYKQYLFSCLASTSSSFCYHITSASPPATPISFSYQLFLVNHKY